MELMNWHPEDDSDAIVYVYLLTNDINGKQYVGITYNPINRWKQHFEKNSGIGRALRKYGPDNFTKEILAVSNRKGALELEAHYCELYDCLHPFGYNHAAGGYSRTTTSQETRAKMSAAKKGSPGTFNGRKHTQEARAKMSAAQKGRKRGPASQEHKDKLSAAKKGRTHTQETRAKMSASRRRRPPISQETREKLSAAHKRRAKRINIGGLNRNI